MYYDRFGNTPQYLCRNFPNLVAEMSPMERRAIAENQAQIDVPCCASKAQRAKMEIPLPFIPDADTQRMGLCCCKRKWRW